MRPDGHSRVPVVREHALPPRQVAERGCLGSRLEGERELLRLARSPWHRLLPEDETELPEELPPRKVEPVAGATFDERLERIARQRSPAGEIGDVRNGPFASRSETSASGLVLFTTEEMYEIPIRTAGCPRSRTWRRSG